jgi:PadR family transcriptional regulator, regulatory protein PadR
MVARESAAAWIGQARRGVLELCILRLVAARPRYGYELMTILSPWTQLAATDGTLYPLLRRLERSGDMKASWQESEAGPPRKYYTITSEGLSLLGFMESEWTGLTRSVEQLQAENREEASIHG